MQTHALLTGFFTGLGLIVAIGAQNAFVLRQGLRRAHVPAVVLTCALSDALLICVGVFASARIAQAVPPALPLMRWGGAAFLLLYGARAARSAWRGGGHLEAARSEGQSLHAALLTCLALTWLNPHVYLDTVVLLGAVSTKFPQARPAFAAGAMTASLAFFLALGYGARLLAPVFARDTAWRLLDAGVALVMWTIALGLVRGS
ncbi:LysE/ArgO family amino acid transporter [Celeribacter indicus]|uniref:L-lysine exporter n=1 Tax=Celeribacter indicus TaxID=1208324 RepID=A0A0B5DYK6_9RHOB|nr:LysE/ArgO family amino acid transporter [Celeribacter indicus]AJE46250.1 L-lysine exporter [Celeribacter indicus]SDW51118.1 L-lysine exporter family protein LysE/ArgO [Celeribacter indicus]